MGTQALVVRMQDEQDAAEARATTEMAGSFLDAWTRRRDESS